MLQLTTKLMNMFSYSITTYFIPGNKDYHSCCNPHSVHQTYPNCCIQIYNKTFLQRQMPKGIFFGKSILVLMMMKCAAMESISFMNFFFLLLLLFFFYERIPFMIYYNLCINHIYNYRP